MTGLKYLGKTVRDPYTYRGSGKRWVRHIKKHGYDVTTEIVGAYETLEEFIQVSVLMSEKLNIVNDPNWANLCVENGNGGDRSEFIDYSKIDRGRGLSYEQMYGEVVGRNLRILRGLTNTRTKLGVALSEEQRQKRRHPYGPNKHQRKKPTPRSEEHRKHLSEANRKRVRLTRICPICQKSGTGNMSRYHFKNCKILLSSS